MLSVWILTGPTSSVQWWDISGQIESVELSTHERGYLEAVMSVNIGDDIRKAIVSGGGTPWVEWTDDGAPIWSGRIERVGGGGDNVVLIARGAYSAFTDIRHTNIYAMSDAAQFKQGERNLDTSWRPEFFDLRAGADGVLISPRRGETHGGSTNAGVMYYAAPYGSQSNVLAVTFTYTFFAPAAWTVGLAAYAYNPSAALSSATVPWTLAGTGAIQTGTVTQSIGSGRDTVAFVMYNTAAAAALAVDTGTYYFRVTNITVWGPTSSETQKTVVAGLLTHVNANNSGQLANTTILVEPAVAVTDATYYDAPMMDVLADVFALGDSNSDSIEWAVWDDRALSAAAVGTYGRVWYLESREIIIERGLEDVINYTKATYTDSFGNPVTGSVAQDTLSQAYWGLIRAARVDAGASRVGTANILATNYVGQAARVVPTAKAAINRVVDASGVEFPLYCIRANDLLVVRGLDYGDAVDTINTFKIVHTKYNAAIGAESLSVELQSPNVNSTAFVSAASARVSRVGYDPRIVVPSVKVGVGRDRR